MATENEKFVDYLDFSAPACKRLETEPRIWRVVDGRRKMASGEIPKFSIQEVPEGLEDEVIDFMVNHLLPEEPMCVAAGVASDPVAVREFRTLWRDAVHQGVSVVALMVNSDPSPKPVIAGVNILNIVTATDQEGSGNMGMFQSESAKNVMAVFSKLTEESDILNRYGVDKYLGGLGLSVHPSLRGQGLGEEILRARDDIGHAYRIPASETVFTATASQILAARVGFEVLVERKYSEILDDEGKLVFPGVTVEYIKSMGKRLQ